MLNTAAFTIVLFCLNTVASLAKTYKYGIKLINCVS